MRLIPLLLVGAGGHANACIDVVESTGAFEIVGLVGQANELGTSQSGYSVIATDADLPKLVHSVPHALIVVGQILSPKIRIRLYQELVRLGFALPTVVASTARVSRHAIVGPGTIVMHSSVVNAGAKVGANCIVNTGALVEHDVIVGDHCHISTGAILNGGAQMGAESFIGSGSVVREGVSLGRRSLVGMGVAVRQDLSDSARYVGGKL